MRISDIDWSHWTPDDVATLCCVVQGGQVLLIVKKRGLGAGKVNGPGGRREPRETARDCAVRETEEEVGITPLGLSHHGTLRFQFVAGYKLACDVFRASSYTGELRETDEATPFWAPVDAVPYERMWADDALWLPTVLAGGAVDGTFVFDEDRMLDHVLEVRAGGDPRA